jgi:predicted permease
MVTLAIALLAALFFSLLPALRLTGINGSRHLKHHAVGSAAPKLTLGRVLIAAQIAVSVPLVVGAALFLRTVSNLGAVDIGFEPRGLVAFRINPTNAGVPQAGHPRLYLDVLRQIEMIPGVAAATLVENALMSGLTSSNRILIDGKETNILMNAVGPGFFDTTGMRLIAGRAPGLLDTSSAPRVAVVNQIAVRELFGGTSPVGRRVRVGPQTVEIIGVVSDSRYARQRAAVRPILFDAALQRTGFGGHHILIRTTAPAATLEPAIRQAVAAVHPDLPVPAVRTQLADMARTSARERVFTELLTLFGAFALLLSGIGLHGVTSYAVARRTNEIGVRVALGARRSQVLWLVLRQVVVLAMAGLTVGVPAALAAGPLVRNVLFGVAPNDAATIACAAIVMFVVAVTAGLLPALKAARLEPLVALRAE